ncbi:MAG: asparagine synthase (glutamine-hydrolyzing), partial [Clostridia bacterium]|nr:asparagine synthase (glutamine-hydrolyzing) [Clostridia bacterium]
MKMCGIAGWVHLKEDISSEKQILAGMSETLKNRGPDASGEWFSPHVMLVHRRLSVVDPAGGAQPMVKTRNGYSYVITYNGELYNADDLKAVLKGKGYLFDSHSDTEVLLTSYMEWGPSCVEFLNGIYAFGIWDEKEQSLFLARDRFGVKPLFFSVQDSQLIFGSEMKALLKHPLVRPVLKIGGLSEILALSPSKTPGHGIYDRVYEVKPAYSILFNVNGMRETCYWSLESSPHMDSPEETVEKVSWWVKDAVKRQLVADVPLCTFLSGGLDSSIITAVAAKEFEKVRGETLHTYSIDYLDNDKFFRPSLFQPNTDAPYVQRMSSEFHTCLLYTSPSPRDQRG